MFELTCGVYENTTEYLGGGIQLTFLRSTDYQLNSIIRENADALIYLTVAILALCALIMLIILVMGMVIKNHANLEKSSFLKKVFTFVLVALLTFLHMPLFDVIIRTIMATYLETSAGMAV